MTAVNRIKEEELTYEIAKKLLRYDPETGLLYWIVRPPIPELSLNRPILKEKVAGTFDVYVTITVLRKHHRAHRVAFLLMNKRWPTGEIDHINRNTLDNRWINLRDVSKKENLRNKGLDKRSKSGCSGVYYRKIYDHWRVCISGKEMGTRKTFEEAVAFRKELEKEYGFL